MLLENIFVTMKMLQHRWTETKFVCRKIGVEKQQREKSDSDNKREFEGNGKFDRNSFTSPALHPPSFYPRLCHNSTSGDSAFQGLLVSLAALISAMNSQLFVFVQQNPGLFMTVYHEGNLTKSSPCYWVSQINDIHWQTWVKQ